MLGREGKGMDCKGTAGNEILEKKRQGVMKGKKHCSEGKRREGKG